MRLSSIFFTLASTLTVVLAASNVVDLDSENFDSIINQGKPALVEFFAPWCGHCKTLAPVYEQLADAFSSPASKSKLIIAKTDADGAGKALGARFGVRGFPTLKWFPGDGSNPIDYESGRDLDSLAKYVTERTGVKSSIKPPPPSAALELNNRNYDNVISSGRNVLVAFTAPWCGHCKSLKPIYEKVAAGFRNEKHCVVAQMNADDEANKPVANDVGIKGFPTIKFFPKHGGEAIDYNGARTEDAIVEFLNEQCGTHRAPGGKLLPTAGTVLALDKLASQFFSSVSERPAVLKKAQEYITSLASSSAESVTDEVKRVTGTGKESTYDYYVKAMQRIAEKGEGWVEKETKRIQKLLESPSLAAEKLDELQTKNNILSAFVHKKFDEVEEALSDVSLDDVEDAIRHATANVKTAAAQATDRVKAEL